jgi:hypothetical protein
MAANSEVHHWVIDTLPINGFYHARCKKCGAETDFPYEEPKSRIFTTSKKPSLPLVIRLPKRPRGRPRKALPRLEE